MYYFNTYNNENNKRKLLWWKFSQITLKIDLE